MADVTTPSFPAVPIASLDPAADLAVVWDASAASLAQLPVGDYLYKHQGWVSVADASTLNMDSNFGHNIRFFSTITTNRVLGTPVNPVDGAIFTIGIKQGGAGSNTLSFSLYVVPSDIDTTLSTTVGLTDFITGVYRATGNKWIILAVTKGAAGL